ncbi:hypothetical protein D3C71_1588310 [compost metagenome]
MPRLVQVGAVEQGQELRVVQVVGPGELHQPPDGSGGLQLQQVQLAFFFADVQVGLLQHGLEQLFLVFEVVVDQPLVQARALGNAVHAGAAQAMLGKLVPRGTEDGALGAICVAHALFGGDFGVFGHAR